MFKASQSKVKTWRRCRHAYHLKYVDRLRRKRKGRPLYFGSIIHEMIEADANGLDPMKVIKSYRKKLKAEKMFTAEKQDHYDTIEDAQQIMSEYFLHWGRHSDLTYTKRGKRYAEHKFEIEVLPGILWNGKLDAMGTAKSLNWLVEHKSFNRRASEDDRWRNLQSVGYFRVIDMLGWKPVDGVMWDYIWSKPPIKPQLLKDGSMSQKRLVTLPSTVKQFIKDNSLDVRDYRTYMKAVRSRRSEYFYRVYTPVDKAVTDEVFGDFLHTMQEMASMHGEVKDRNIERHCSWCDFEPLCRATMQGLDRDFILEREYAQNQAPYDDGIEEIHTLNNKQARKAAKKKNIRLQP